MENTVVSFKNVTKQYKLYRNSRDRFLGIFFKNRKCTKKVAVDNISFSINKGETVAFFGRNGAGKSTILKMLTGVSYPTKGKVKVNGKVSALLELTAGFEPEFTGRDNIYLRGYILGMTRTQVRKKMREILVFSGLKEYIDQPIKTYSSGMKARLGFSTIVSFSPEILVVDEALSVGDNEFRLKCLEKIRELMETGNNTLIFVTHSISQAEAFCKRGIVVKNGQIICDSDIKTAIAAYKKSSKQEA